MAAGHGALVILDGPSLLDPTGGLRIDAVREAIASRLHLVPRLRQVIYAPRRGFGGPLWVDALRLDVLDHVVVCPLPSGTDGAALLAVTEELRSERKGWTVMDRLGEIRVPTLVMAGRDDFVFPPEHQGQLAAGIPNARLEIIERAGHNPHDERTAEVMGTIRSCGATSTVSASG